MLYVFSRLAGRSLPTPTVEPKTAEPGDRNQMGVAIQVQGASLTLFRAEVLVVLPSVFLVPLPSTAYIQLILCRHCYLLFIGHISAKKKKSPGQVRSGHQSRFLDLTSEKLAITSFFFTEQLPFFRYS